MGSIKATEIKIELAITDDLKQSVSVMQSESAQLLKSMDEANKALVKVRQGSVNANKTQSAQGKFQVVAEQKAKEIGVPVSSIPGYSEAQKAWDALEKTIQQAKDY